MDSYLFPEKPKQKKGGETLAGPSLFDAPTDLQTMHRHPDRETSVQAAIVAQGSSQRLKQRVYEAFKELGPMTDAELGSLPRFEGLPFTSVSKRRTDLVKVELLEDSGDKRGHPDRPSSEMIVWRRK